MTDKGSPYNQAKIIRLGPRCPFVPNLAWHHPLVDTQPFLPVSEHFALPLSFQATLSAQPGANGSLWSLTWRTLPLGHRDTSTEHRISGVAHNS